MVVNSDDFPDGVAVVIGGSGGIGRAIVKRFIDCGCSVVFTFFQNSSSAESLTESCGTDQIICEGYQLDCTDSAEVTLFFNTVYQKYSQIHTVVNAAGPGFSMKYVSEITSDDWHKVVEADLSAFFNIAKNCLPYLRNSGGSLVQVSSIGIRRWPKRDALSVVPKAAIESLIRGIAREEGRYGVRANSVQLGVINAGMFLRLVKSGLDSTWIDSARANTALKRFGEAEDVANAVIFLASGRASYITGESLRLDGGYSV